MYILFLYDYMIQHCHTLFSINTIAPSRHLTAQLVVKGSSAPIPFQDYESSVGLRARQTSLSFFATRDGQHITGFSRRPMRKATNLRSIGSPPTRSRNVKADM